MSLYGNKFSEIDLNKPIDDSQVDEYINKIMSTRKVDFGLHESDCIEIEPHQLSKQVKKDICKILNTKKLKIDMPKNNINASMYVNSSELKYLPQYLQELSNELSGNKFIEKLKLNKDIFLTKDYKNLRLGEIIDDTTSLDNLILKYKYIDALINFSNSSTDNMKLINSELHNLLNNYISTNEIVEDDDYIHPNLYDYKILKIEDIHYLYNKYIAKSQKWKYHNILIYSVVGFVSTLSGYILYNVI